MSSFSYLNRLSVVMCILFIGGCGSVATKEDAPLVSKNTSSNLKIELNEIDLDKYHQAKGHMVSKQFGKAKSILSDLNSQLSRHTGVLTNLAICEYHLGNITQSQDYINIVLNKKNAPAQAYNLQGLLNVKNDNYIEALESYKKALKIDSNLFDAHFNLALLYDIYFQDIANAYKHYELYLALTPLEDEDTKNWLQQLKFSLNDQ